MEAHEDPELRRVLKMHAKYFVAPADLHSKVLAAVRRMPGADIRHASLAQRLRIGFARPLPRLGIAFTAGVFATLVGVRMFYDTPHDSAMVVALLSDHTRALMTNTTIEIASSNSHTVKPWLSAKLGYSPDVVDLAKQGFPLVGGRRGFLAGEPVAVMVYTYQEHEIDLYAVRGDAAEHLDRRLPRRDGYNFRSWDEGGMRYVAVSDVAAQRLDEFANRIHENQANPSD